MLRIFIFSLLLALCVPAHALSYTLKNTNSDTGDGGWITDHAWADGGLFGEYWKGFSIVGADRSAWMSRTTSWATFISNTTTFGTSFAQAASVSFDWSYTSTDTDLTADSAGYVLNGVFYTLSSTALASSSGHIDLTLAAGDSLAWFVSSSDELGGRGLLAIRNVALSAVSTLPVPEPKPALMWLSALGMLGWRSRTKQRKL